MAETMECTVCGGSFNGEHGLRVHTARTHTKPKKKVTKSNGTIVGELTAKRMQEAMAEGRRRQENISGLVSVMFPDGVPASKIVPLMEWIDSTRELIK